MKKLLLLLLTALVISGAASAKTAQAKDSTAYICPPCDRDCDTIKFTKGGACPYCGMVLTAVPLKEFEKIKRQRIAEQQKQISICFYLQDGVEILDFAGPMEVFDAAGFKVFTVSKTTNKITSQGILTILPQYSIENAPKSDITVFFGGQTNASVNDPALMSWIQSRKKTNQYVLSVCTGAFIIGKAGILDNLTATTYHTWIGKLQQDVPKSKVLANVRYVDNGDVITTAGVSAGIDGALYLVEKLKGREFAKNVADMIEYDKWVPGQGLVVAKHAEAK